MELKEAVKKRRSIRSFSSQAVDKCIIEEIISDALWTPSWGNTQPWEITVVTGDTLATFKEKNQRAATSGKQPNPNIPMPLEWPEINKRRYQDVGRRTLKALSIPREDAKGRLDFYNQMFGLFGAPVLLLIAVDKAILLEYSMLDAGLFVQTLCLLAHERGLGTCILAAAVQYPDGLRTLLEIPDTKRIVIGVALGWPDHENPVNLFERARGSLNEFVHWVE
ncbi:MAG: nitroreductase [Syntrophales bacterium]|nr:nitroreductase [Syntrophales bacterium]